MFKFGYVFAVLIGVTGYYLYALQVQDAEIMLRAIIGGAMAIILAIVNLFPMKHAGPTFSPRSAVNRVFHANRTYGAYGFYLSRVTAALSLMLFGAVLLNSLFANNQVLAMTLYNYLIVLFLLPILLALCKFTVRGFKKETCFGFFYAYVITDKELVMAMCRAIPVYRIPLAKIKRIEPWRMMGRNAFGSDDDEGMMFGQCGIWFWPRPILLDIQKLCKLTADNYEWTLALDDGLKVVISGERDFMNKLLRATRALTSDATESVDVESAATPVATAS